MEQLKLLFKYLFLFLLGGAVYFGVEILWRGFSHYSMFITGGICFLYAGLQNEYTNWDRPLWKQVLQVDFFVLSCEFICGVIVNLWLGLNIWDYSNLPFNILGQVCLPYALLFLPLSLIAIVVDDYVRWILFNEEKPYYKIK